MPFFSAVVQGVVKGTGNDTLGASVSQLLYAEVVEEGILQYQDEQLSEQPNHMEQQSGTTLLAAVMEQLLLRFTAILEEGDSRFSEQSLLMHFNF